MEVEISRDMGPERILPNSEEELGQERLSDGGAVEVGGEWSGEDPEEDEGGIGEDEDTGGGGYYYQPLNQDPDGTLNFGQTEHSEEVGSSHAEQLQDVQERIEAMGLFLPQPPPPDSDEEEDPRRGRGPPQPALHPHGRRSRGAGEEDHGCSQPALPGHSRLGPGDLGRPMEGHGPADPPITTELRRAAAAAQVSRPVVKD
ncbi:hypothetical protein ANANG_G00305620 [Anguilla anguilla]|uniref:Male-enhanced antigen 1 n=1 Tax=Anguilla anguilla TaxID=7936 RepID=A0A9D3LJV6_ANGAN|nr:hypothetical protein ANANG_G00305620 [Anguilla anguilla]